jgi:hypothetical protein
VGGEGWHPSSTLDNFPDRIFVIDGDDDDHKTGTQPSDSQNGPFTTYAIGVRSVPDVHHPKSRRWSFAELNLAGIQAHVKEVQYQETGLSPDVLGLPDGNYTPIGNRAPFRAADEKSSELERSYDSSFMDYAGLDFLFRPIGESECIRCR